MYVFTKWSDSCITTGWARYMRKTLKVAVTVQ